jgi:hypothetical protein
MRSGPVPVANQWVVLHRVGPDRAGPLDSVRTGANGAYAMRHRTSGDSTALYFVSTTYGGVAYFTSPLRAPDIRGEDATLTVFDTTSAHVPIRVGGRHFIVGSAQPNGNRPIGEVYDLENDTTVTAVARDSLSPVWTTHIPEKAQQFQLNTRGDLGPGSLLRNGTTIGLLVPVSPGIRQVAFTYELPPSAFPLRFPIESPTGVLEVLVQDPTARVSGAQFRETPAQEVEGRTFRRFLAQDVPSNAVIGVEVPRMIGAEREKVYIGVATALLAAMAAALVLTARRAFTRGAAAQRAAAVPRSESLLREIARLDAEFERKSAPTDADRAAYEARRAELKSQLMGTLSDERKRPAAR